MMLYLASAPLSARYGYVTVKHAITQLCPGHGSIECLVAEACGSIFITFGKRGHKKHRCGKVIPERYYTNYITLIYAPISFQSFLKATS